MSVKRVLEYNVQTVDIGRDHKKTSDDMRKCPEIGGKLAMKYVRGSSD